MKTACKTSPRLAGLYCAHRTAETSTLRAGNKKGRVEGRGRSPRGGVEVEVLGAVGGTPKGAAGKSHRYGNGPKGGNTATGLRANSESSTVGLEIQDPKSRAGSQ